MHLTAYKLVEDTYVVKLPLKLNDTWELLLLQIHFSPTARRLLDIMGDVRLTRRNALMVFPTTSPLLITAVVSTREK